MSEENKIKERESRISQEFYHQGLVLAIENRNTIRTKLWKRSWTWW
jgi:hypothetical protein